MALLLAGVGLRLGQQRRAQEQVRRAQDRIDVEVRSGRTSLGAGGDFYVTLLMVNTGPDVLAAVGSDWRGVGLAAGSEIGGLGPLAPGSSASFTARLVPDCRLLRSSPGLVTGRLEVALQAPSGRRRTVGLDVDPGLELLGTAREACRAGKEPGAVSG